MSFTKRIFKINDRYQQSFKTKETIALTKGVNKYLTDMATFLKQNGSNGLGVR